MAIDNGAVDTLRSMTAKGLLATLIRAKDGDDVTVEALCKTHSEGRGVLTNAMRALVDDAFVVKFKIQRDKSELVTLEDGTQESKRGGSWYTTFTVDSIPFTLDDVAAMLEDVQAAGNVKAIRVEPMHLDPRKAPQRPTDRKLSVGASRPGTENPQVGPTDRKPTVGQPTVGRAAAKKIKTGEEEDSLSDARGFRDEPRGEREAAAPGDKPGPAAAASGVPGQREDTDGSNEGGSAAGVSAAVESVVGAYVSAYVTTVGVPPRPRVVERLRADATVLLAAGKDAALLEHLAADLAVQGWEDLVKHLSKNQPKAGPGQGAGGREERCPDHPARYRRGCLDCALAVPA
ncbi:hypothetical protein [Streptomyces halstedii]|uniref:Uncharacterized protein n=1 Tax=Streptomyces halstedii TaxID=1944 RepID=A0A6N9TS25_STRHA|nr:hypothetical protein [Streptomyces halstedii]NEA14261.1 hypothetical protein [Streptomyces halstedii]